ncbi:MAG: UDP binding domain-containing protein [Coriobacteriaceae bacterium]
MPDFVLERAHDIMEERGIRSSSKVGIYGLTYKEDVDDVRESPTLQMIESMDVIWPEAPARYTIHG